MAAIAYPSQLLCRGLFHTIQACERQRLLKDCKYFQLIPLGLFGELGQTGIQATGIKLVLFLTQGLEFSLYLRLPGLLLL